MKKSTLLMIVSVVLAMTLSLGSTLAYLQDSDSDVNVMTLGSVYIEQHEQERGENGELKDYPEYPVTNPLYPAIGELAADEKLTIDDVNYGMWGNNNVLDKIVTVENTGKSGAYVRTIFAVEDHVAGGNNANLVLNWNKDGNWTNYSDKLLDNVEIEGATYDVYVAYYNGILASKVTSVPSLLQVALNYTAGNADIEAYGDELNILVLSQAVQTEGFDGAVAALNEGFGGVTEVNVKAWFEGTVPPVNQDTADTSWYDPENKQTSYTIDNAQELAGLSKLVWEGNTFSGVTFELTDDINLYGADWQPIGRMINTSGAGEDSTFMGNFDGQNHTVSNFVVNTVDEISDTNRGAGLFGAVRGNIKNLTVENVTIDTNHWAGVIAGCVEGSVTNCHVKNATITCLPEYITEEGKTAWNNGDKAGAIVGYQSEGSAGVSGCSAENVTITAYRDMGALVGASNRAVTNNTVSNVTLIQDNTHDYGSAINVNKYVGRLTSGGSESGNTGDVTIIYTTNVTPEDAQARINSADAGAVIVLGEGNYETLVAKSNITIRGTEDAVVGFIDLNASNNVTISGVEFDATKAQTVYSKKSGDTGYVANITGSTTGNAANNGAKNIEIVNCSFEGTTSEVYAAICLEEQGRPTSRATNIMIDNCVFNVTATGAGSNYIRMNYLAQGDAKITDNTFAGSVTHNAMNFTGNAANLTITGNKISGWNAAKNAIGSSRQGTNTIAVTITGNTFTNPAPTADDAGLIELKSSYTAANTTVTISDNTLAGGLTADNATIVRPQ